MLASVLGTNCLRRASPQELHHASNAIDSSDELDSRQSWKSGYYWKELGENFFIMGTDRNIEWHKQRITKRDRWGSSRHKSALIWITGLSASGKSSIATELEHRLFQKKIKTSVLDGDTMRHGLNSDLGFSVRDRKENLRRVGEVAKLLVEADILTIAAFISPYSSDRKTIRELFIRDNKDFIEVYLKCDLAVCEMRDPKGLYKKARRGEIPDFTGISQPYETPANPEITIETDRLGISESVDTIITCLLEKRII